MFEGPLTSAEKVRHLKEMIKGARRGCLPREQQAL